MTAPASETGRFAFRPGERASLAARLEARAPLLRRLVIAIDGPAGSGKTTTARAVAQRLGLRHLDTGALYRALTLAAQRAGVAADDASSLVKLLQTSRLQVEARGESARILLQGVDVTDAIRAPAVTAAVSQVSALAPVRQAMLGLQQTVAREGGTVMEGRDIGTVVLPEADVKIFLTADVGTRAARRQQEELQRGRQRPRSAVEEEIRARDHADTTRSHAPLQRAEDAIEVDTTGMDLETQIDAVLVLALRQVERANAQRLAFQPQDWVQPGYRHFRNPLYGLAHVSITGFLRAYSGIRVHVHPSARMRGSTLVACNHIHGLDPPVVGACLPFEVWWVAKQELFRQALVGRILRRVNAFPIQRGTADYQALDRAVDLLRSGHNVLMFPEGTRQKPGKLGKPRWGFGYVALRAGRPIVPAFVRGTGDRRPRFFRREPLEVWVGEPFVPPRLPETPESYRLLGEQAMESIAGLMLRSAAAHPLGGLELPGRFATPRRLEP